MGPAVGRARLNFNGRGIARRPMGRVRRWKCHGFVRFKKQLSVKVLEAEDM